MDPRKNPYAPGAGTKPPELTGRDEIFEKVSIELDRCRSGLSFRSFLLVGLRGVGKTVLLNQMALNAEAEGFSVLSLEVPEKRSLPALLIPALRSMLIKLDKKFSKGEVFKKTLRVLGGFVSAMKLKYEDIEFGLDLGSEPGVADSGDLESDLFSLFEQLGLAAKEHKTAIVLFIDEVQYIEDAQFAALIMALHKCTQKQLPITIVGAGLPQLVGQAGRAKSYAERLFEYPQIGPLTKNATIDALVIPAKKNKVEFTDGALANIFKHTSGYPYFIQEWGKHCWQAAEKSPIDEKDVKHATEMAIADLDMSFFRVRFDRLTPTEKKYLRAMAELGTGPHRSGDIAQLLKKEVQAVATVRASLIGKGMIYSPEHGDNHFTVPLFDEYLRRVLPDLKKIL
jgi:hypothetical protein